MKNIVNVNIRRHGDGKRVYISVQFHNAQQSCEYIINADQIAVHLDPGLPDTKSEGAPVSIS